MKITLLLALSLAQPLAALTIKIDYSYDTTNFFDTQEKKDAIEAVAKFYADLVQDKLLRIDATEFPGSSWSAVPTNPATGGSVVISNLVVPEDTMIVYVGARDLGGATAGVAGPGGLSASGSGSWVARVRSRGNPGANYPSAQASLRTDFAPWGGSIAFDIEDEDRTWNFSMTQNLPGTDFIPIALHEMGHVLGIGTADSWKNKISSNVLNGNASIRAFGSAPGVQADKSHFGGSVESSKSYGAFDVAHGTNLQVLMLPTLTDDGTNLVVASDLDLAGLVDIGWEILPSAEFDATALSPASASFIWKSSSFFDYQIQRGTDLVTFPGGNSTTAGSGGIQTWTDSAPLPGRAFYRLAATPATASPAAIPLPMTLSTVDTQTTCSEPPRIVTGCGNHP